MRIVCPECQAAYNVGSMIKNAILVCHRCQTEFDTYGHRMVANSPVQQVFKAQEDAAPTFGVYDLIGSGMRNSQHNILLWMMLVLLFLSAVGLTLRWEHWQFQSSIRALVLQSEQSAAVLDRDWRIVAATVSAQWLKREDKSLVLLIEGQVENMVNTALPVPDIQLQFVTQTGRNMEHIQVITAPASLKTMRSVPFESPAVDEVPIAGLTHRGFMLLIEDVPDSTLHILMHALAVQRHNVKEF